RHWALAAAREPRAGHQRPAGADRRAARDHAGDAAQRRRRCGGLTGSSSRRATRAEPLRPSAASGNVPPPMAEDPSFHTLLIERDVLIPTRDGGSVCANVFRPEGAGEFPVIITMGPYPKDIHFSQWNPVAWRHLPEQGPHMHWETVNPEWWVPRGYVVI